MMYFKKLVGNGKEDTGWRIKNKIIVNIEQNDI